MYNDESVLELNRDVTFTRPQDDAPSAAGVRGGGATGKTSRILRIPKHSIFTSLFKVSRLDHTRRHGAENVADSNG